MKKLWVIKLLNLVIISVKFVIDFSYRRIPYTFEMKCKQALVFNVGYEEFEPRVRKQISFNSKIYIFHCPESRVSRSEVSTIKLD